MIKKLMLAAAAVAMTASPVLAANPAGKLSVNSAARASAKQGESNLGGGFIVPLIAVIAVIIGVIVISNGDDDPKSP